MASVDVVIPSYQYGRYLRDCALSVLRQENVDLRLLIIDNASTDDSVEIAQDLALQDPRVEVVAQRSNKGPHASFNAGIEWAKSDYFLLLFADDLLAPGALARASRVMTHNSNLSFTHGRDVPLYGDGPIPSIAPDQPEDWQFISGMDFIEQFCRTAVFHIPGSTLVVRTDAQKQAGYYCTELEHSDDYDMWLRLARLGDVAHTQAIQGILRHHGANRSAYINRVHHWHLVHTLAAADWFFGHDGADLAQGPALHRMVRRTVGERAYWSALSNLCRGDLASSRELFRLAFRLRPSSIVAPPLNYLFKREDTLRRVGGIVREILGRSDNPPLPKPIDP